MVGRSFHLLIGGQTCHTVEGMIDPRMLSSPCNSKIVSLLYQMLPFDCSKWNDCKEVSDCKEEEAAIDFCRFVAASI